MNMVPSFGLLSLGPFLWAPWGRLWAPWYYWPGSTKRRIAIPHQKWEIIKNKKSWFFMVVHGFFIVFSWFFQRTEFQRTGSQRTGFQRTGYPLIFIHGYPSMNINGNPSMNINVPSFGPLFLWTPLGPFRAPSFGPHGARACFA